MPNQTERDFCYSKLKTYIDKRLNYDARIMFVKCRYLSNEKIPEWIILYERPEFIWQLNIL